MLSTMNKTNVYQFQQSLEIFHAPWTKDCIFNKNWIEVKKSKKKKLNSRFHVYICFLAISSIILRICEKDALHNDLEAQYQVLRSGILMMNNGLIDFKEGIELCMKMFVCMQVRVCMRLCSWRTWNVCRSTIWHNHCILLLYTWTYMSIRYMCSYYTYKFIWMYECIKCECVLASVYEYKWNSVCIYMEVWVHEYLTWLWWPCIYYVHVSTHNIVVSRDVFMCAHVYDLSECICINAFSF